VRTRLTYFDFAAGTAVASIPLTPNYESTVSCREIIFPLLKAQGDDVMNPIADDLPVSRPWSLCPTVCRGSRQQFRKKNMEAALHAVVESVLRDRKIAA
jgi:hypothetical protein